MRFFCARRHTSRASNTATVTLNFVVSSGAATAYTVTSANLAFPVCDPATARASGATTVTDFNGDGASLTGSFPGNASYRTFYNDAGNTPATGTPFASLLGNLNAGPHQSDSNNQSTGPSLIGVPVSSMSAQFRFATSAGDSASGTSVFVIAPTPGSAVLGIAAFGLASVRHRPVLA